MPDNTNLPAASGKAATDEVSYSGDTAVVQLVRNVAVTGSEGSKTVVENMPASLGLASMANSFPVVIASDQDPFEISGTVELFDLDPLPHGDADSGGSLKVGGHYVASPTGVTDGDRTDALSDQFGQQRVVIGDASDASETLNINGGLLGVNLATNSLVNLPVNLVDDGGDAITTLPVSGPLTDTQLRATAVPVSGTVTANAGTGTLAVSAASLPLPTGAATAAKQPALGTAGTSSADVLTVQGRASMTPLLVDGSGVTQPVSGTVTANAGSGTQAVSLATLPALVAGSAAIGKLAANSGVDIGDVDVTSSALPTGAATSANQSTEITSLQLLDDLVIAEDAAHANGDKGIVALAVRRDTATSSTVTDGDYGTLTTDTAGRLRTTAADTTQPVSGTFWQATQPVSGTVTANAGSGTQAVSLASTTVTGTVAVTQSGTWDEVGINDSGNSITVDGTVTANIGTGTLAAVTAITNVVHVDDNSGSLTVDGGVAVNASAANGCDMFLSIDLDESEEDVKTSAGTLYGWYIINRATTPRYVKFYNATAANVTVGTTTPVLVLPIPGSTSNYVGANMAFAPGIAFGTAICAAATTGIAHNDTGAPAANDVVLNAFYK